MKKFRAYCLADVQPGNSIIRTEKDLFFEVRVYQSKGAMRASLNRDCLGTDCTAMCADYVHKKWDGKRMMTTPEIGCLYFHHDSMRVGVICHEAVHAALAWHRAVKGGVKLSLSRHRTGPSPKSGGHVNDDEENVAWVAGNIARQIVAGYQTKGKK